MQPLSKNSWIALSVYFSLFHRQLFIRIFHNALNYFRMRPGIIFKILFSNALINESGIMSFQPAKQT